jgi:hypothetical protein
MDTLRTLTKMLLLVVLVSGLAACGTSDNNEDGDLPTRFVAPQSTDMFTPTDTSVPANPESPPTLPPTWTVTTSPTLTATLTVTPSLTITDTPTRTLTATPSETPEMNALMQLALLAQQATVLPQDFLPTAPPVAPPTTAPYIFTLTPAPVVPTVTTAPGLASPLPATQCQYLPPGGFGMLIVNEPDLVNQIGCPIGAPPTTASFPGASQMFQGGSMVWVDEPTEVIYAFYSNGTFHRFDDTWDPAVDPESGGETPPEGLLEPVRGFGKVWRTFELTRTSLGWALADEAGVTAVAQDFTQGRMLYIEARGEILILTYQGNPTVGLWRSVAGSF